MEKSCARKICSMPWACNLFYVFIWISEKQPYTGHIRIATIQPLALLSSRIRLKHYGQHECTIHIFIYCPSSFYSTGREAERTGEDRLSRLLYVSLIYPPRIFCRASFIRKPLKNCNLLYETWMIWSTTTIFRPATNCVAVCCTPQK